jgi:dipeptidyl-peptidase-4
MRRNSHALVAVGAILLAGVLHPRAQERALTIEDIYDPERRVDFSGSPASDVRWLDDASYLTPGRGRGAGWRRVEADTGEATAFVDTDRMADVLAGLPGVTREEANGLTRDLDFNPARTGVLLTIADDLYVYDFPTERVVRLTETPGTEELATFSPDGRLVAYVRDHNLFVAAVAAGGARALTTDGTAQILNGKLDWLYQEEIYGRGIFQGYWWSPDSARLAFLQLDEREVSEYTVVDHMPYRPALEVTDYPKAGDTNPTVRLGVAPVAGGAVTWIDLGEARTENLLVVDVGWTPGSDQLVHQVQDREQTWLDLRLADPATGRARTLLRETTEAWVNPNGNPIWLEDGSFLWLSERSGFKHVYRYDVGGAEGRPVTSGRWDVRTLYGVDERNGWLYYASSEASAIGQDLYRVRLDGTRRTRLSSGAGTHSATFSPSFARYVDVWSSATTPPQVRLHRADGTEIRVLDANPVPALDRYDLAVPEFVQVATRDGFPMEGMLIKPPDFDPSRQYPVYQFTYAGPGASLVRDRWGGSQYMFHQLLAQQGIVVWILDNRSASGKGAESQWTVYRRLGELELQDLEDGVAWLGEQGWVDPARIVLSGWSYGGFMTSYAMTHSTSWAAGIAGGPVTDWRDYDTVYTERLMMTPQNNPDGYRETAPRHAAANLQGRLLLIHGTMDDNVHMQNTLQFAYELQRAGKDFELMLYPRSRHSITDPRLNLHLRRAMLDFVRRAVDLDGPMP